MTTAPDLPDPQQEHRLFVAIPLPETLVRKLEKLSSNLRKGVQFTASHPVWVAPSSMHLTLRFLGGFPGASIPALIDDLATAVNTVQDFELRPAGLGVFPDWQRPRVLWTGLNESSGRLKTLQMALEGAAVKHGCEPSKTPFHPHLTLARFKSMRGIEAVHGIVDSHRQFRSEPFWAGQVILFRSEMRKEGALHVPVATFKLDR